MDIDLLMQGLREAATSPLSFVAYTLIIVTWGAIGWKESRIKNISKALDLLPKNQRLKALELEYRLVPRDGLSAELFLKLKQRTYRLLAFGMLLLTGLVLATLTMYRYIELDRINIAGETMKIAHETFMRGTTAADDNRFKTAIGKLEESIRLHPTYTGYINLADIYEEVGDVDSAIRASQLAMTLDSSNPTPQLNLGMLHMDKGDLKEAEEHLLKAQNLFKKLNKEDVDFTVSLLVNLGNVYYEMAENSENEEQRKFAQKALDECFSPALKLRGAIQEKRYLANLLGNTANTFRLLNQYEDAEMYMFQSIALKKKIAMQSPLWSSLGIGYFNLGDVYLKQKKIPEAKIQYEASRTVFVESNHAIGLGSVELAMGEIAKLEGDMPAARKYILKAKEVFAANNLALYTGKAEKALKALGDVQ